MKQDTNYQYYRGQLEAVGYEQTDYCFGCELDEHGTHYEGAADSFITKLVWAEPTADFDGDGDVDLRDFAAFQNCFTGQAPVECGPGCSLLDLDSDDDIDLDDYAAFESALGPL